MENWGSENWGLTRWGMDINYVPVTIGVDDGTAYEEIYPTVGDFVTAWTDNQVNNAFLYFSNTDDYVEDDDPSLNPINLSEIYYVKTKTGYRVSDFYKTNNMSLKLALEL